MDDMPESGWTWREPVMQILTAAWIGLAIYGAWALVGCVSKTKLRECVELAKDPHGDWCIESGQNFEGNPNAFSAGLECAAEFVKECVE